MSCGLFCLQISLPLPKKNKIVNSFSWRDVLKFLRFFLVLVKPFATKKCIWKLILLSKKSLSYFVIKLNFFSLLYFRLSPLLVTPEGFKLSHTPVCVQITKNVKGKTWITPKKRSTVLWGDRRIKILLKSHTWYLGKIIENQWWSKKIISFLSFACPVPFLPFSSSLTRPFSFFLLYKYFPLPLY